ncbi:ADGRL2 [Branchiostoma lanceolatum]|uniref:ADGRL2 protein n=1 Tax=Branchiostoma lanceolatum TaxID=7740 RepID=A0A8K0AEW1_BRALA|nr:ADGRL2 [Branchiostoma lanceolatum]
MSFTELVKSCNDIKLYGQMNTKGEATIAKDGFFMINVYGNVTYTPVYCDMESDPKAGWTLLVTSRSMAGWNKDNILSHNEGTPTLNADYSILGKADQIKMGTSANVVQYRLEAGSPGHWGGVWEAPVDYSFTHNMNDQTNVTLVAKFGDWDYGPRSIGQRMPWIVEDPTLPAVLTTAERPDQDWYGTIVGSDLGLPAFQGTNAPWIQNLTEAPGAIWYWMRELAATDCEAAGSLQIVKSACDGLTSCTVQADNGLFGDPCRGVRKYLEITYNCVGPARSPGSPGEG